MDLHRLGELRSRAYHRAIADKLDADIEMVARTHGRVEAWERPGSMHPSLATRWREVLALPTAELRQRLVEDSEGMPLPLRSSSFFAGEFAARERWMIWETVRREATP